MKSGSNLGYSIHKIMEFRILRRGNGEYQNHNPGFQGLVSKNLMVVGPGKKNESDLIFKCCLIQDKEPPIPMGRNQNKESIDLHR